MEQISEQDRAVKLANAVATDVAAGWRVESQSAVQAVMVKGGNFRHGLHIFLDIITVGLWLFVHIPLYLTSRRKTRILRIDDFGNTLVTEG